MKNFKEFYHTINTHILAKDVTATTCLHTTHSHMHTQTNTYVCTETFLKVLSLALFTSVYECWNVCKGISNLLHFLIPSSFLKFSFLCLPSMFRTPVLSLPLSLSLFSRNHFTRKKESKCQGIM